MKPPTVACWACGNRRWWRSPSHATNPWICGVCHPPSVKADWAPVYGEDHED